MISRHSWPMWVRDFLQTDRTVKALVLCALYSVGVWGWVIANGLHKLPGNLPPDVAYVTYFETINWWPFPFFFLLLIPVTHLTWRAFIRAWLDLPRTHVLTTLAGEPPTAAQITQLKSAISKLRRYAIFAAIVASVIINLIDTKDFVRFYSDNTNPRDQLHLACKFPSPWTGWVFAEQSAFDCKVAIPCDPANIMEQPCRKAALQAPPEVQIFAILSLIQQCLIVFFVALCMGQLLLHTLIFGAFDKLIPMPKEQGLRLQLNPSSPMREFGLERWNYALNNFYWMSCPVLLIVLLSRSGTAVENYQPGQELLGVFVPALLLAPMIATIFSRQVYLPAVWDRLDKGKDEDAAMHHHQQLWPLDRNWSSKLGIILAFALAALSLGSEASKWLSLAV